MPGLQLFFIITDSFLFNVIASILLAPNLIRAVLQSRVFLREEFVGVRLAHVRRGFFRSFVNLHHRMRRHHQALCPYSLSKEARGIYGYAPGYTMAEPTRRGGWRSGTRINVDILRLLSSNVSDLGTLWVNLISSTSSSKGNFSARSTYV